MAPSAEQPVLARQIEIISHYLDPRRTAVTSGYRLVLLIY
jgi:hypothetical protein